MSNSTTLLDTIATNQSSKEVTANALFDAASVASLWGRRASTTTGLTWGYYGGWYNGQISNGTVSLTAGSTNYLMADASTGAVSVNTTGFVAGKIPLYSVVTGVTAVTSYTDRRSYAPQALAGSGVTSVNGQTGAVTLTTDNVSQGSTNLYFSNSAARGAVSATGSLSYNATTGVFSFTDAVTSVAGRTGAVTLSTADVSGLGTVATLASDTDGTLAANSDTRIATQKATKAYVDSKTGGTQPYDLLMFFPGTPTNSQVMGRIIVPRAVTLPASLTGSYSSAIAAATGSTTLTLARNGVAIGTVNFAAGASSATFTFASSVSFAAGDVLTLTNQATADATLANVSLTLAGTR